MILALKLKKGGKMPTIKEIRKVYFLFKKFLANRYVGIIISEESMLLITLIKKNTQTMSLNMYAGEISIEYKGGYFVTGRLWTSIVCSFQKLDAILEYV